MPQDPTDRSSIQESQLQMLQAMIDRLLASNAFYRLRLIDAGFDREPVASLEDFARRCPVTTKSHLADDQQAHPPLGTNHTEPLERYTRFHQTSGTTAQPVRWLDTDQSWQAMIRVWAEVFKAAGVGSGDRVMFTFSFGPFIGFWLAFEAAQHMQALCMPGGGLSSLARLTMMADMQATVLCCTPTYALRLGHVAAEHQIDLSTSTVRSIIVGGEPGGSVPATRAAIEHLWPTAKLVDHHGMTEVGPCTYTDPNDPTLLRIVEPEILAEVVDPMSLEPVAMGEPGELLLTTLHRGACPVLRYRTGDIVKQADVPGRFALRGGIIGRADQMVSVRGVNVYPSAVDDIIRKLPDVGEYRVTIRQAGGLTEMSLEIEPTGTCPDHKTLVDSITQAFQLSMALRVPVTVVEPNTLPRFEMKAKRWVTA